MTLDKRLTAAATVLGECGPLGAYGTLGDHRGWPDPAANCSGATSFALPGFAVG
ncbi:MAG: hypothetical protein QOK49_4053 [Baekduia sp.]|jgi:hypothetical protein|nr:hypothetical protein [Baekduia sp.]